MNASYTHPLTIAPSARTVMSIENRLKTLATAVAPPVLRIALALPFFRSGLTRWDGFLSLSAGTVFLFENDFKIHILGHAYPYPAPLACAYLVAVAEIVLPALLVLGLATRFAATGLLIMTGMIQLTNPAGWANFHLYWAAMSAAIIALGAGPLSLDGLVATIRSRREAP
jgi:putative oxidoreductase